MSKSFYLTTTLPYVNAKLHMGHALEFVRADIIARTKVLQGYELYFNTGTDEHGMKIYEKARSEGKEVENFVSESFVHFQDSVKLFGMLPELHFIRTTDKKHIKIAQDFWLRCFQNGYIYKKNYQTKYCVGCESEKTDSDLVNGICPDHPGISLEFIEEENYFFKYSAFTEKLLSFYTAHPEFVVPDFRFNEIKAFVSRGLEDFSISRLKSKMPWGISVPNDPEHVMYVWFDALTNYISTFATEDDTTIEELFDNENFKKYWLMGTPTQYCGKDNLRFQSAMWQAMLMAASIPNSYQIIINGFITADGGIKMSKTLGNVVDPKDIVDVYGIEALRLFLAKEISNYEDSPFTEERFKLAYNANLANGLGNLTSRILTLSEKYLESCPEIPPSSISKEYFDLLNAYDIAGATAFVWSEIAALDKTIHETEPFKVVKVDIETGRLLITDLVIRLYTVARMLYPIMPETNRVLKELIKNNKKPDQPLFLRKE